MAREVEERQQRRMDQCASINAVAEEWARKLAAGGLACPHCGRTSPNIRYYDKRPDRLSYFICQECGKSFQP
jgi:transposase-like protein